MISSINFKNILVVGVGLIGGSIIRALKVSSFSGGVYGIDRDKKSVNSAYGHGYIQNKDTNIPKDLDDLLVIFSVPVLSIQEAMSQINIMINTKNVIYTDTLSVKSSILLIKPLTDSLGCIPLLVKPVIRVLTNPGCKIATEISLGFKSTDKDLPAMHKATLDMR